MVFLPLRSYLRAYNPSGSVLDVRTHNLLIKELKKRIRRNQTGQIEEIKALIHRSHTLQDPKVIQTALTRCYLQGLYRDHEELRYFLKAKVETWPNVSILDVLKNDGRSLERLVKSPKNFPNIKLPTREERILPSLCDIMDIKDHSSSIEVEPLEIQGVINQEQDKLDSVLQKVLKLYHFISSNSFIHSRRFNSPVAIIPTTVLGDKIPQSRFKNLIKKKISYVRNALMTVPPLEYQDSLYLESVLDGFYQKSPKDGKLGILIRREYKKFLRRTYTIDPDFNIIMNKYAYIKAKEPTRDVFFPQA